jgi:hypothetical protein
MPSPPTADLPEVRAPQVALKPRAVVDDLDEHAVVVQARTQRELP